MNDNLSILIKAILDEIGSKNDINEQLRTLAVNLDKLKIKVTLSDDALQSIQNIVAGIKTITPATQQANQALQQVGQQTSAIGELWKKTFRDNTGNVTRTVVRELKEVGKTIDTITNSSEEARTIEIDSTEAKIKAAIKYQQALMKILNFQNQMRDNMNNLLSTPQGQFVDSAQLNAITQQINSLSANSPFLTQQIQSIAQAYKQVSIEAKNAVTDQSAMIAQAKKEAQEQEKLAKALSQGDLYRRKMYGEIARLETKPEYQFIDPAKLAAITAQLDSLNAKSPLFREKIKEISQAYKELTISAKDAMGFQGELAKQQELQSQTIGQSNILINQQIPLTERQIELQRLLTQVYAEKEVREVALLNNGRAWSAVISENGKQELRLKGTIDQANGSLYQQDQALKQVRNTNMGFFQELGVALKRVPVWMLGMTMFYQSLRFFTNGVKYINELDSALNEIVIFPGKSTQELQKLGFSYQKMAYDMASTTKQIAEASVTFYRQGLNQAEVMERVRITTMAAKISGLEFAETAELITAATNTMGVSVENAADVFAYLG